MQSTFSPLANQQNMLDLVQSLASCLLLVTHRKLQGLGSWVKKAQYDVSEQVKKALLKSSGL